MDTRSGRSLRYVGIGLATGPHLHYEYRVNGVLRILRRLPLPGDAYPIEGSASGGFRAKSALWQSSSTHGPGWYPELDNRPSWIHPISKLLRTTSTARRGSVSVQSTSAAGLVFVETVAMARAARFVLSSEKLDEFFEIRRGGLKQLLSGGRGSLRRIRFRCRSSWPRSTGAGHATVQRTYRALNDSLMAGDDEGRHSMQGRSEWSAQRNGWMEAYFEKRDRAGVSPLGLDPGGRSRESEIESQTSLVAAGHRCVRQRQ